MWKTAILSKARAHKIIALILVSVVGVSATVLVYRNAIFAGFQAGFQVAWCPNTIPFRSDTMPPRTVYQISPPGRITICFTSQVQGQLSADGLTLVPNIVLTNSHGWSSCNYGGTNCGGVNVTASPASLFSSPETVQVVATIEVPAGSTHGLYYVFFAPGCTAAVLSLKIGELDQILQPTSRPTLACPGPASFSVGVAFDSYAGMIPTYQNGTIPLFSGEV